MIVLFKIHPVMYHRNGFLSNDEPIFPLFLPPV